MKQNQTIPFGYTMVDGHYRIHDYQATVVQGIFNDYHNGMSVIAITNRLKQNEIETGKVSGWNKNKVCRILSDERYLGNESFPKIIDADLFSYISERRKADTNGKLNPAIRIIRNKIVCEKCSSTMVRITHIYRNKSIAWSCNHCGIRTIGIFDDEILDYVELVIEKLISAPNTFLLSEETDNTHPLSLANAERNLDREFSNPAADENYLLQMIQKVAKIQYQFCESGKIRADNQYLLMLVKRFKEEEIKYDDLIRQSIQSIRLSVNGQISVKLINNKML